MWEKIYIILLVVILIVKVPIFLFMTNTYAFVFKAILFLLEVYVVGVLELYIWKLFNKKKKWN